MRWLPRIPLRPQADALAKSPSKPRDTTAAVTATPGQSAPRVDRPLQVIVGTPNWTANDVNLFSVNLVRGLRAAGMPAQVLLTEHQTDLVTTSEAPLPPPEDVSFIALPVSRFDGWGAHWGATLACLESVSPCVFLPNDDWRHSVVIPRLGRDVVAVGIVHGDDALHYAHIKRLAKYWNAVVAVGELVARRTAEECPEVADRLTMIPISERMVEAYRQLFLCAFDDAKTGRFVRPRGPLSRPPAEVAGVSLFPVETPFVVPDLGEFPSSADAEDYKLELERPLPPPIPAGANLRGPRGGRPDLRVIVTVPTWTWNGVNFWAEDLVRGLQQAGVDARLLLTEEGTEVITLATPRMHAPTDISIDRLRVHGRDTWGARWGALLHLLESTAPCVYMPNYDWRHAGIVPLLSDRVMVVGTLHDAEALYEEQARRLGSCMNALVATSREAARHLRRRLPELEHRLEMIPHGLAIPVSSIDKPLPEGDAIVLVLPGHATGGLVGELVAAAAERSVAWTPIVVNPSPALASRLAALDIRVVERPNRQEWLTLCHAAHVVVGDDLSGETGRFAIEAMGHRTVPVKVGSLSWDGFLIDHERTGLVLGSDASEAVRAISALCADSSRWAQLAGAALSEAPRLSYRTDQMVDAYAELFAQLAADVVDGAFRRPSGPMRPPPAVVGDATIFPVRLRHSTTAGAFPSRFDAERFKEESAADWQMATEVP